MKIKEVLKRIAIVLGCLFGILVLCICGLFVSDHINIHYRYSIPMPEIMGKFEVDNDSVTVWGLENIIDEDTASLAYNEITCYKGDSFCNENR